MKHQPTTTANALAVLGAIWYMLCVLWVLISRSSYMGIMATWFHGVDFNALPSTTLTFGSVIFGFISFVVFAWVSGYFFAKLYNYFAKS